MTGGGGVTIKLTLKNGMFKVSIFFFFGFGRLPWLACCSLMAARSSLNRSELYFPRKYSMT